MTTQNSQVPVNGQEMLAKVANFLSQYLACTHSQLAVLSLWTLHTHCFTTSPVTPYLHIRSQERDAGKTVCMELLNLLCNNPWLAAGCTPAVLLTKLTQPERGTLLLDDCDPVLARARNPVMLGLFTIEDREEEDFVKELLHDMRELFAYKGNPPSIPTGFALCYLHEHGQHFWRNWRDDGKPMDAMDLANLLKPKRIRSHKERQGPHIIRGYRRKDFQRWWPRAKSAS